ncbi:MAG: hypothetical protein CMJ78_02150 [Planctomycetaceae bacterium]|nr:hypothetical protein [Planctomycetaceae bacterium]
MPKPKWLERIASSLKHRRKNSRRRRVRHNTTIEALEQRLVLTPVNGLANSESILGADLGDAEGNVGNAATGDYGDEIGAYGDETGDYGDGNNGGSGTGPGNEAPTAYADDEFLLPDNQTSVIVDVLSNDFDPDGDLLTAVIVSLPTYGNLTPNSDGTLTYTATTASHYGLDSFTYIANDGVNDSNTMVALVRRFGLRIKRGATDVTLQTTSALMGEKVSLTMDVKGGPEIFRKDENWAPHDEDAFHSWSATVNASNLKKFDVFATPPDPNLSNESLDIHHSAPGLKTVSASATYRGVVITARTYVNIARPTITVNDAITMPLQLLNANSSSPKFGGRIDFSANVLDATLGGNVGVGYSLQWVQIVDVYAEADKTVGDTFLYEGRGLDESYPFEDGASTYDVPGIYPAGNKEVLMASNFKMYGIAQKKWTVDLLKWLGNFCCGESLNSPTKAGV